MSDGEELDAARLAHTLSMFFDRRVVELAPNAVLDYDPGCWCGALVFVMAGEIELECSSGVRQCFRRGDILAFAQLTLRSVRNSGPTAARLLAVSRSTKSPVSSRERCRHTKDDIDLE